MIGVVDIDVLRRLWPPVVIGALVLVGVAAFVYRGANRTDHITADDDEAPAEPTSRPFALRPALVLATVLTLALLVSRWAADVLGPNGLVLAAFAAGWPMRTPAGSRPPAWPPRATSPSMPP